MTQQQLADASGIARSFIADYEVGVHELGDGASAFERVADGGSDDGGFGDGGVE